MVWFRIGCNDACEGLGRRAVGERLDKRRAAVAGGDDLRVQWDAAEERHAHLRGKLLAAADLEQVDLLAAVRAEQAAHVLDDPGHAEVERLAEGHAPPHVGDGDVLRRGDDDRPRAVARPVGPRPAARRPCPAASRSPGSPAGPTRRP